MERSRAAVGRKLHGGKGHCAGNDLVISRRAVCLSWHFDSSRKTDDLRQGVRQADSRLTWLPGIGAGDLRSFCRAADPTAWRRKPRGIGKIFTNRQSNVEDQRRVTDRPRRLCPRGLGAKDRRPARRTAAEQVRRDFYAGESGRHDTGRHEPGRLGAGRRSGSHTVLVRVSRLGSRVCHSRPKAKPETQKPWPENDISKKRRSSKPKKYFWSLSIRAVWPWKKLPSTRRRSIGSLPSRFSRKFLRRTIMRLPWMVFACEPKRHLAPLNSSVKSSSLRIRILPDRRHLNTWIPGMHCRLGRTR